MKEDYIKHLEDLRQARQLEERAALKSIRLQYEGLEMDLVKKASQQRRKQRHTNLYDFLHEQTNQLVNMAVASRRPRDIYSWRQAQDKHQMEVPHIGECEAQVSIRQRPFDCYKSSRICLLFTINPYGGTYQGASWAFAVADEKELPFDFVTRILKRFEYGWQPEHKLKGMNEILQKERKQQTSLQKRFTRARQQNSPASKPPT